MPLFDRVKTKLAEAGRQFDETDLRWSYIIIGIMAVVGVVVNLLLPHGWTVWPLMAAAAIMLMVHEAAERNGEGVPPLRVYGLFIGAIVGWLVLVMFLSTLSPVVVLLALGAMGYYAFDGYRRRVARDRLVEERRTEKLCVHCGEPADPKHGVCENCGEEPDPETARLDRISAMARQGGSAGRARAILTPTSNAATAAQKERALLAKRQRNHKRRR